MGYCLSRSSQLEAAYAQDMRRAPGQNESNEAAIHTSVYTRTAGDQVDVA
jgi:hypothetical protein